MTRAKALHSVPLLLLLVSFALVARNNTGVSRMAISCWSATFYVRNYLLELFTPSKVAMNKFLHNSLFKIDTSLNLK